MSTPSIPSPDDLLGSIARRASVSQEQAAGVLNSFGVTLLATPPTPRSITIRRLTFSGEKVNTTWDGPFTAEFRFTTGVTALITESNLRGKSTVLELLTWLLRGTPRKLRSDVRPWLRSVALEYAVNGTPMTARLTSEDGTAFQADLWTAGTGDELEAAVDAGRAVGGVRVLAEGLSESDFAAQQQAMMLKRLGLEPITNWQKYPGSEEGRTQVNGWPAYFGAIYLPEAGSDVLLGDVVMAGLPARLLQLFCNVPLMTPYIKCRTLQRQVSQDDANRMRRAKEDDTARASQRGHLIADQQRLQQVLTDLAQSGPRPAEAVRVELAGAEEIYTETVNVRRAARMQLAEAIAARQVEERRRNDENETAIATLLFHGLKPKHCPRCETAIGSDRTAAETEHHRCAVCTNPIEIPHDSGGAASPTIPDGVGSESSDAGNGETTVDALQALTAAEDAARTAAAEAEARHGEAEERVNSLTTDLAGVQTSREFARHRNTEIELARISGHLEATSDGIALGPPSDTLAVLDAAVHVLNEVTGEAAGSIFDRLNVEIADLGRSFGIDNLDHVRLDRRGGMRVTTAGVDESFSGLSGGERLRLRVAVLIALLRVGHRSGIGTHPGLILLDSPGSEELAVDDERRLLAELDALKGEVPSLQVCIASAEGSAVVGVIDADQVYSANGEDPLW